MSTSEKCSVCAAPNPIDWLTKVHPGIKPVCGDCKQKLGKEVLDGMAESMIEDLKRRWGTNESPG